MTNTKEIPGPFDGLTRAKPGEPVFPLQGGDPQAAGLVRQWVQVRRDAAAKMPEGKDRDLELLRCREADEIAMDMDAYRRGEVEAEARSANEPTATSYGGGGSDDMAAAIRLSQRQLHHARKLDNAVSDTVDAATFCRTIDKLDTAEELEDAAAVIRRVAEDVRPSRG
jgi:acetylornithine deacetylase/succinyl-diaminopimelate desuccinylase-like protein